MEIIETKYWSIQILKEEWTKIKLWKWHKKLDRHFLCKCHCGKEWIARMAWLKKWKIQSCWCSSYRRKEFFLNPNYKHWKSHSNIERVWIWLNQRCNNEKHKSYKNYWLRWIKCEWNSFEDFYKDMGETYKEWLSIDRIDVNWNYCKENCKWSNDFEQANNTRRNVYIELDWITKTMQEWCRELWISYTMVRRRIQKWMNKVDAILTPNKRLNG